MENDILTTLDFHIHVTTPFHFLKRFLLSGDAETLEILLAHVRRTRRSGVSHDLMFFFSASS